MELPVSIGRCGKDKWIFVGGWWKSNPNGGGTDGFQCRWLVRSGQVAEQVRLQCDAVGSTNRQTRHVQVHITLIIGTVLGCHKCVERFLVDRGLDATLCNNNGHSALHKAAVKVRIHLFIANMEDFGLFSPAVHGCIVEAL